MESTAPGLWLLPTFGRAATHLPRFFAHAAHTGMSTPGWVVVDEAEWEKPEARAAYEALNMPEDWQIVVVPGGSCAKATQDAYARLSPDLQWVGWLADDLIPQTPEWDKRVIAHLNGWNVASTNDGNLAPKKFNGATVWSGDVLRAIGFFYPPGFQHWYIDDIVEELNTLTGFWVCDMDILVGHVHASGTGEKDATTLKTHTAWDHDEKLWARWRENDLVSTAERVLALMEANGVKMMRPDVEGVRLLIATPCGDGKFDYLFRSSLDATEKFLTQFGAKVHFAPLPYCSDPALARAKLFGAFLRSEDDFLLMVDADQDWRAQDVATMLMKKLDFLAVAGIRKTYPISYAVNVSHDDGSPAGIMWDSNTGLAEVTHVGMAFALISRAAAVRMAQHYADLAFVSPDGREDIALFNPMVFNRRYLGEDFAFCQRWRDLPGRPKLYVMPQIALGHTGAFRWFGAWGDEMMARAQADNALNAA